MLRVGSCCLPYIHTVPVPSLRQQGRDEIILLFRRHQAKENDPSGYSIQLGAAECEMPVTALSHVSSGLCSPRGDSKSRQEQAPAEAGDASGAGKKRRPRIANI